MNEKSDLLKRMKQKIKNQQQLSMSVHMAEHTFRAILSTRWLHAIGWSLHDSRMMTFPRAYTVTVAFQLVVGIASSERSSEHEDDDPLHEHTSLQHFHRAFHPWS